MTTRQKTGGVGATPGTHSIETEIERSRETENWERVQELAGHLRAKSESFNVLANFLVGEAKLEGHLKKSPQNVKLGKSVELDEAKEYLLQTVGEDAKRLGVHLDSYILLGKLHYSIGEYKESLLYYDRAQIDTLEEKPLPPRSLKIMAEAFAIKAVCLEKTAVDGRSQVERKEREAVIVKCYEVASDLAVLFLQVADKSVSFGQSTWSVASGGTSGSTSPALDDTRPKMGSILESSLYKAAALHINQNKPLKAITRLRNMLMAEESESTREIRRNVACQLSEVLLSNCSVPKFVRPDLDVAVTKKSKAGGDAWRPKKQSGPNLFTPRNKQEELILILLLSENIANKGAILSQGPGSAAGRKSTYEAATVTYDLLTLTLARCRDFKLLINMLERSMKFSFGEKHTWEQFALVLAAENKHYRSLLVARDMAERMPEMELGLCLSTARNCYEQLSLYEEGVYWAKLALKTPSARFNRHLEARCYVFIGIGHLLSSNIYENLKKKTERIEEAGGCFRTARKKDDHDHLTEFCLAYFYAITRQNDRASHHVRLALALNPLHLQSLHLMILLLTANKENEEALKLASQTVEEYPDHLEMRLLKIKLEEYVYGTESALLSAKELMHDWQIRIEEFNLDDGSQNDTGVPTGYTGSNTGTASRNMGSVYGLHAASGGIGPPSSTGNAYFDGGSRYDTFSEKDSTSLYAQSIAPSHIDRTVSEIASSVADGQFPHRPSFNDPTYCLMRIWLVIAELHLGQDDWNSASQCEFEARQLFPNNYYLTHVKGLIEEVKGNFEEAKQLFESAVAFNPHNAHSLYHLARVHHELKFHHLCINSLNIALRNNPYCQDLWLLLGKVYETLIDAEECRELDTVKNEAKSFHWQSNGDMEDEEDYDANSCNAAKAAECYSIALSLHNSSPIVPFSSISIAYE